MNKYVLMFTFLLISVIILAAKKQETYVQNNVFHSLSPRITVKIDSRYKYLGRLESKIEVPSPDSLQVVNYDTKSYVFVQAGDLLTSKILYIQTRREQTHYAGNLLGDIRLNIRSGLCYLGENEYQCYTRVVTLSKDEPISRFILENGYTLPECVLTRAYARVDTSHDNYLIVISYSEELSGSGLDCNSWQVTDRPTNEQKQYSDQFERRSRASFEIVKKSTLKDRKQKLYLDEEFMRDRFIPSRDQP